jgi:hypothetical protein
MSTLAQAGRTAYDQETNGTISEGVYTAGCRAIEPERENSVALSQEFGGATTVL